ncbi:KTSC domain-containing protein [Kurthia huakuii]|uniref:KTSC domain-containing protein n=1 Tax=Kurthia huakuii TaxID=1421019 RepID=UPI000495CDF7|nr:KTSC domain-containing protein [Kurthia huakuii]MBM7699261.1 hypothetical protein [Kurthia huakuii]
MHSHMIPVESSKIQAIGYEASPMILRVEFHKDGVFEYYGVPELVYNDLMEADSHGTYFTRSIKDRYRYVKVG